VQPRRRAAGGDSQRAAGCVRPSLLDEVRAMSRRGGPQVMTRENSCPYDDDELCLVRPSEARNGAA
jgi:hypothetical protein